MRSLGYVLYPLPEAGPLGRLHAGRRIGNQSMQIPVPPMGTGVFHELPPGSGIRAAGIGGDWLATRVHQRQGLEMRKVGDVPGCGASIRGTGVAQSLCDGV